MYSLLFRSKWLAALWVGTLVGWIWFTTPRDQDAAPVATLVGAGAAQFGTDPATNSRAREEQARRRALADFNAGASEPVEDGFPNE